VPQNLLLHRHSVVVRSSWGPDWHVIAVLQVLHYWLAAQAQLLCQTKAFDLP
jgi:hypothetical protein